MANVLEKTAKDLMSTDYCKADAESPLTSFIGRIRSWKDEEALIFENGAFIGVVSFKGLLRKRVNVSSLKVKHVAISFPKLKEDDSLLKIAELMYCSGARLLPVMRDDKVLGVVYCKTVIELIKEIPELKDFKAKDISTTPLISIDLNDPIEKAIDLMKDNRVRKIPVFDKNKFVGALFLETVLRKYYLHNTLAENDLYRNVSSQDHTPNRVSILKTPVVNELDKTIITSSPNDSVSKLLSDFDPERGVFVMENNLPIGVITAKNLLKLYFNLMESPRNIRFIDLPALDEIDKAKINTVIVTAYDKVKKIVGKVFMLTVHFKEYEKDGFRKKHVVTFRTVIGGKNFKLEKWNWNVLTAVQQASHSFVTGIKRTFKDRRK